MKNTVAILLITFCLSSSFSMDTDSVQEIATTQIENNKSDTLTKENSDPLLDAELADKNAEKNAEYFMYGFLVLGAFLVFWKFKNNK